MKKGMVFFAAALTVLLCAGSGWAYQLVVGDTIYFANSTGNTNGGQFKVYLDGSSSGVLFETFCIDNE